MLVQEVAVGLRLVASLLFKVITETLEQLLQAGLVPQTLVVVEQAAVWEQTERQALLSLTFIPLPKLMAIKAQAVPVATIK
jgi:hypothetical protein